MNKVKQVNLTEGKLDNDSPTESILLKWVEIMIALVCGVILVYTILLQPSTQSINGDYTILVATEIVILMVAIFYYQKGKLVISSSLLILAGLVGPWWSVLIDESIRAGNLLPLVYTTIPILFSCFFSSVFITLMVGVVQTLGIGLFIYFEKFDLSQGAGSLFFFVIFIFTISMIINIQNRNNRLIIYRQVEQLKEFANHDPLTGLHNRRFPIEYLQNELVKLKDLGGILSIILFDVDDFKYYNDTYGHACGDEILVTISRLVQENFRQSDVSCRYGGDEFFIAMSDTNPEEARKKLALLQRLIAEEKFETICDAKTKVTISVGIAAYPRDGESVREVLKAADDALYRAKEKGKDCIEITHQEAGSSR
ncbi:MAG: hypothetical protein PWQ55_2078 [Chloroflexota bacterium]|nr:hypothetical protein [Chloroflexota bacterium]